KSKTSRADRAPFPCSQSVLSLSKCDFPGQNLNAVGQKNKHSSPSEASAAKRHENTIRHKSPLLEFYRQEGKKPLNSTDNFKIVKVTTVEPILEENLKDGEKNYAGPKFTEPPSPSVLPKPPSHWVGENSPRHSDHSRALMTVHLKSLLKVQAMP
ncbi:PNRC1 protein, partial [Amia calva]|nr:PNRC1 protein [Amia calva]